MKKLVGVACIGSVLALSGCTWFDWKCSDKTSCCADHRATCPCGMKDCHCPAGTCTCDNKKEGAGAVASEASKATVIAINSEKEFEEKVLSTKKPAVVKFGAPWCGACRDMKPVFEDVAKEMGDKYIFADVDVDKAGAIAEQYGIKGIPAFLFFEDGKEAKDSERIIGTTSKENFKKAVDENLGD